MVYRANWEKTMNNGGISTDNVIEGLGGIGRIRDTMLGDGGTQI